MSRPLHLAAVLLSRFGLAASYLSSVVDRFGGWGRPGTPGVVWGDFQHFVIRVEALAPLPSALAPVLAWIITVLEAIFGLSLLVGLRTRMMGMGSACLLLAFAAATAFSPGGVHLVLASSILSAAGASLLLAFEGRG
jgi:uncharacterized membrane protein YphA (DoxX/SURF4 family)